MKVIFHDPDSGPQEVEFHGIQNFLDSIIMTLPIKMVLFTQNRENIEKCLLELTQEEQIRWFNYTKNAELKFCPFDYSVYVIVDGIKCFANEPVK